MQVIFTGKNEGVELPTKTLDLPLNTEIIRQALGLMMEDEKDVLAGNIESHLHLQVIICLHQRVILKDTWKMQFLGFIRLKIIIILETYEFVWKHYQYTPI